MWQNLSTSLISRIYRLTLKWYGFSYNPVLLLLIWFPFIATNHFQGLSVTSSLISSVLVENNGFTGLASCMSVLRPSISQQLLEIKHASIASSRPTNLRQKMLIEAATCDMISMKHSKIYYPCLHLGRSINPRTHTPAHTARSFLHETVSVPKWLQLIIRKILSLCSQTVLIGLEYNQVEELVTWRHWALKFRTVQDFIQFAFKTVKWKHNVLQCFTSQAS